MYFLSGKYIPASEVFRAMAEALKDAAVNTDAEITLPGEIKDGGKDKSPGETWPDIREKANNDAEFKELLW